MKLQGLDEILREFTEETNARLRDYHTRSIAGSVSSTMKRVSSTRSTKGAHHEKNGRDPRPNLRQQHKTTTYLKHTDNVQLRFDTPASN